LVRSLLPLQSQELLLILDNCKHVLDGCVQLVNQPARGLSAATRSVLLLPEIVVVEHGFMQLAR